MDSIARWLRRNRLILGLSAAAALCGWLRADELQPLTVRDFSAGLATENDSSIICDGCAQDMLNVDVENGSIEKRRGSVKVNSTALGSFTAQPVKLFHAFDDANHVSWIITHSSNSLLKSNDGGATNSILTSTHGVTSDNRFCAINAFSKARLTDGTTNWITWDGTSVGVSTASPKGKTCEFFAERVWTSVGSFLEASANGNAEDWVQNALTDDDAFFTYIRQNDGYDIRALKRFKNGMLVLKDYSTDFLVLNQDGLTFTVLPISSRVGTQQPDSVEERENDVVWLAHDGYYSYDGSILRRISDAIAPTVNQIIQLSVGEQRYTETGQVQFQAGTNTQTSPNIVAGSVLLSSYTATDDSTSDFNSFTSTSSVYVADGRVYLSTNNTDLLTPGFESGSGNFADNWESNGGATRNSSQAHGGTYSGNGVSEIGTGGLSSVYLAVLDANNLFLSSTTYSYSTDFTEDAWVQKTVGLSSYTGRWIKLEFRDFNSSTVDYDEELRSDAFICSGSSVSFYAYKDTNVGPLHSDIIYVDDFSGGRSSISSGTLTGQTRNTGITNPVWLPSTPTYTTNGHSLTFQTETSANGSAWDAPVAWSTGAAPASASKQYIRYTAILSTGGSTSGVGVPFLDTAPLAARAGSGRYLSSAVDTGGGTSWNPFAANFDSDGGTMTFEVYTDSNTSITPTVASTFLSSQTVTNGATPSLTISTYAFVGTTFTITASGQDPSLDDFTLSWNEGGGGNFPVWSTYYQGSYISAVAISSNTGNDRMLVYDRNGAWTLYSYPAYSLGIYKQKPYFGSNVQGDLVRFQADDIFNDYDGSAINSYWTSKDFDFGYPLTQKTVTRYYLTAAYALDSDALFEWGTDRGSLTSESTLGTLDLDLNAGFFRKVIAPSSLTYKKGLSHRLKFSDSDVDDYFKILSFTITPRLETAP